MNRIPSWAVYLAIAAAVLVWLRFAPPDAVWSPRSIIGAVMPKPKVVEMWYPVVVPGPTKGIKAIPKEKIAEKYGGLPTPNTLSDNSSIVTEVAEIPPSPAGGTALAVLCVGSDNVGVGSIEYQPRTPPFIQFKRSFGAEAWWFPAGPNVAEAALVVNPLRIGPVEVKAKVGVDMQREDSGVKGFVAVGGEIKF